MHRLSPSPVYEAAGCTARAWAGRWTLDATGGQSFCITASRCHVTTVTTRQARPLGRAADCRVFAFRGLHCPEITYYILRARSSRMGIYVCVQRNNNKRPDKRRRKSKCISNNANRERQDFVKCFSLMFYVSVSHPKVFIHSEKTIPVHPNFESRA